MRTTIQEESKGSKSNREVGGEKAKSATWEVLAFRDPRRVTKAVDLLHQRIPQDSEMRIAEAYVKMSPFERKLKLGYEKKMVKIFFS